MVYVAARQPQTPLQRASTRKRHTVPSYERTIRLLPAQQRDAIQAYVGALCAEAAAQRNETARAKAALEDLTARLRAANDARTRGNHHREGERP